MKKIALISDTHSYLGDDTIPFLEAADEIWHGGDIGDPKVLDRLEAIKPTRSVYGNIDDKDMRLRIPLNEIWECEGMKIFMTHIGGYPGRYTKRVSKIIKEEQPNLYICGHSHILKVMPDKINGLLHMNPGACGVVGFNKFRTILTFEVANGKIENLNAVELGLRSSINLKREDK